MSAIVNPLSSTNSKTGLITDPVRNFKFLVQFTPVNGDDKKWGDSFGTMGFVSLSGLSVATESIAYREGGYNTNVHQIPGQSSFTPISLSKGVMLGQQGNADWMRRLFTVLQPSVSTNVGAEFRCNLDITVLTHPNPQASTGSDGVGVSDAYAQHASMRFKVYNAWITSLAYSNLDAGANTLMVEELQLVHEGFDVSYGTSYKVAGSAPTIN
jgi:phage tail-like protein